MRRQFGEDSELSDLSDSDGEPDSEYSLLLLTRAPWFAHRTPHETPTHKAQARRSPSPAASRSPTPAQDVQDEDEDADDYTGDRDERIKKLSKIAKKKRAEREEADDDDREQEFRNRK